MDLNDALSLVPDFRSTSFEIVLGGHFTDRPIHIVRTMISNDPDEWGVMFKNNHRWFWVRNDGSLQYHSSVTPRYFVFNFSEAVAVASDVLRLQNASMAAGIEIPDDTIVNIPQSVLKRG